VEDDKLSQALAPTPTVNVKQLQAIGRELLLALGEDPDRNGLKETPKRWANWWQEFIEYQAGNTETTFEAITTNQIIVVSGIRVYSICEHHLLPFWCDISIGYIPRDKILGLSKFARIAHNVAHGLQVQERLVQEIANEVESTTNSPDVVVLASGVHMCMVMRGIKTEGVLSSLSPRGMFKESPAMCSEFLLLSNHKASVDFIKSGS
jgi:GTP cyclohydrolase I